MRASERVFVGHRMIFLSVGSHVARAFVHVCVRFRLYMCHLARPQWSGPRLHSVLRQKTCTCVCTFVFVLLTLVAEPDGQKSAGASCSLF